MKRIHLWIFMSAASILLAAGIYFLLEGNEGSGGGSSPPPFEAAEGTEGEPIDHGVAEAPGRASAGRGTPPTEAPSARKTLHPQGLHVAGRVSTLPGETPVEGVRVSLLHLYGNQGHAAGASPPLSSRTSGEGRFLLPVPEPGIYTVEVRKKGYVQASTGYIEVLPGRSVEDLSIRLAPGFHVSGQVEEAETEYPVAGVLVTTKRQSRILWSLDRGGEVFCPCARTDEKGRFTLQGLDPGMESVDLAAIHPDFVEGTCTARAGDEDVTIRLERGYRIHGTVLDDRGAPAPGVEIMLSGPGLPVQRRAYTGGDGRYVTPPLAPGEVRLHAAPAETPGEGSAPPPRFTPETKTVVMEDHDLEVDFGPVPGTVTWRGTLRDAKDRPVPGAELTLFLEASLDGGTSSLHRAVSCNGQGGFEAAKLPPGRYDVRVAVPASGFATRLPAVTLPRPGMFEKDLHIPGGTVQGVVRRAPAGLPLPFGEVRARCLSTGGGFSAVRAAVDERGRFRLQGLRPGRWEPALLHPPYDAFIAGYMNPWILEGPGVGEDGTIALGPGERIEGICITVRPAGQVRITGTGFTRAEAERLGVRFISGDGFNASARGWKYHANGILETETLLRPGPWEVHCSLDESGPPVVYRVQVEPEGLVELHVQRAAFPAAPRFTTLSGTVRFAEGRPAASARVRLQGQTPANQGIYPRLEATCDSTGRFTLPLVPPNTWAVRLAGRFHDHGSPGETEYYLEDLVVPEDPPARTFLELLVPPGTVTGLLCDRRDGKPLPPSCTARLRLVDSATGRTVLVQEEVPGGRFTLHGIPDGTFRLEVRAEGFLDRITAPFSSQGTPFIDLGTVPLEPAAYLVVQARDPADRVPAGPLSVDFPPDRSPKEALYLAPGRVRFTLPPGILTATARIPGRRPQAFTAVAEAGKTVTVEVTLEPGG